ncbi:ABC transporter ATP-binding protein [Syntrophobacter fumaroxidans]|uniref:ABC transporter related n=1 Tax=Syntrophobacter fumaroxidans (strain DSM 10017 / MPOB) TaxID=335543 RepID=A0LP09_SYNFM|nr:ABC transporter ATP-binding protein [Syntrophobacter fumaroxidans]ABK19161.1 ABC transporter related [Syntrophobacter fumaroxidans MPOB]
MEEKTSLRALRESASLYLENVRKCYGPKVILKDIDLAVKKGEFCSLVGPSGCGKSTLLRLILGQEYVTSGTFLIGGKPVGPPDTTRGIVYQRYSLFPHLTVLQNVVLGLNLSSGLIDRFRMKKQFHDEAMRFLEEVELADHSHKYPHELSGGMQQRVAISQALIMKPELLLMDEPFGALDPGTREHMQIFLLGMWEKYKMTVFFVTHDLEEAVFLGTRILVLSQYWSDGKTDVDGPGHGARIVSDYPLARRATSTAVKKSADFGELIQKIRHDGFDPEYLQHVTEFDLRHPDSFRTLDESEAG